MVANAANGNAPSLPRILMCPPEYFGIEYEINPWMHVEVGSDPALARAQWNALHEALLGLGVAIDLIDPVQGQPDLVFTANAGLVYRDIFIVSHFRHAVRQGETPHFKSWAESTGFDVIEPPGDGNFEGAGDALFCGEALFAGYRLRSDARCLHWIGDRLGVSVLPLELVDPRFYHLDTCFCPLDQDSAIYYPGAFDDYGRAVLRERIPRLVEVNPEEAASFSCNAVVVGRTVLLNKGAPKLAASLTELGFRTIPLGFTEFIKSGGSAKCLTLRVDGEEAAGWKSGPRTSK
ncbi:MAG: amidinotransferase [Planctomycetes bacterium SCN 63-9]|nr:MAG: amidinotransferase [Planctomycetes bacterium SCN 63-9]